jgi:CBS domain-containing protein
MKIENWMNRDVACCRPESSMSEAAHLMWEKDCGVLPVVDSDEHVVGVITDRDLCMGAYHRGSSLNDLRVEESMSRTVHTCRESDPIEEVIRRMGDNQVRRVPVLDASGRLVGILSMNDILRRLVGPENRRERAQLTPRLIEAQAAICEPHVREAAIELAPAPRAVEQPVAVG